MKSGEIRLCSQVRLLFEPYGEVSEMHLMKDKVNEGLQERVHEGVHERVHEGVRVHEGSMRGPRGGP